MDFAISGALKFLRKIRLSLKEDALVLDLGAGKIPLFVIDSGAKYGKFAVMTDDVDLGNLIYKLRTQYKLRASIEFPIDESNIIRQDALKLTIFVPVSKGCPPTPVHISPHEFGKYRQFYGHEIKIADGKPVAGRRISEATPETQEINPDELVGNLQELADIRRSRQRLAIFLIILFIISIPTIIIPAIYIIIVGFFLDRAASWKHVIYQGIAWPYSVIRRLSGRGVKSFDNFLGFV